MLATLLVLAAWGEFMPATANPGGMFILTQTGLFGPPQAPPCDGRVAVVERPITNFDTSEGPFDTIDPPFSNCDPTLVPFPVITLTFSKRDDAGAWRGDV